jgi:hypothetical protein
MLTDSAIYVDSLFIRHALISRRSDILKRVRSKESNYGLDDLIELKELDYIISEIKSVRELKLVY